MINQDIQTLLEPPGAAERVLKIRDEYLTPYQKDLLKYRKCYQGKLFDELSRLYPWGTQMSGDRDIERREWIPRFIPSIAKELAQTLASYLTGKDKFPSITLATTVPPFGALPIDPAAEDKEAAQARAQNLALNKFVRDVLEQADFQTQVANALEQALVMEEQPVLTRFYGGRIWVTMPDRVWCTWEYSDKDPCKITVFKERWFFTRPGEKDEYGRDRVWLFRRTIDERTWLEEEVPIIVDKDRNERPGTPEIVFQGKHGFNYCPCSIVPGIERKSIYADEVMGNIKGYIESYNDVHCGVYSNSQPQWVTLSKDTTDDAYAAARPGADEDEEPLVRGRLWRIKADSIQSFANQTAGYEMAEKINQAEKSDIRTGAHIVDIPMDTELSGKAIMLLFGPQYAFIDRWRGAVEKALRDLIVKVILAAAAHIGKLLVGPDTAAPKGLRAENLIITLDWGQMVPVTPESVSLELENVIRAKDAGLLSEESAQEYILPLFGREDIEGERERLAKEKAQKQEDDLALAEAAFKLSQNKENDDDEFNPAG